MRLDDGFSESAGMADLERGDVVNERVDSAIALQLQSLRAGPARQRVEDMIVSILWSVKMAAARCLIRY